jgi:hypothetical protein
MIFFQFDVFLINGDNPLNGKNELEL